MTLKTEQIASIMAVCNGKDVFVWLPTGFGKSLCYEVLPFVMDWAIPFNRHTPPRKSVNHVPGGYSQVIKSQGDKMLK